MTRSASISTLCAVLSFAGSIHAATSQEAKSASSAIPSQVFWGDSHIHTQLSADAGLFGNKLGLEDAYRFARGEEVTSSTGLTAQLERPLDWVVITDHSDMMGFAGDLAKGADNIVSEPKGKEWYDAMQKGGEAAQEGAFDLITTFAQGKLPKKLVTDYSPGSPIYTSVWKDVADAAENFNNPGTFSTIIGYEWTSLVKGANMHRNVLLRDGAERALQVSPMVTLPPTGSTDPLELYKWLDNYETTTGGSALAIAHNGNLSNGIMFPVDAQYTGRKIDARYIEQRNRWEPLYEWTQIKGDGEAHPFLSPDDEFADYETWDQGNLDLTEAKTEDMLQYEYARTALRNGLALAAKHGTNPYKFGAIGSTDTHTSLTAIQENNFFGKHISSEPSPERITKGIYLSTDVATIHDYQINASGWTGVWAPENTREAIWDALARKEVYASTGPRITVRLFAGWDYTDADLNAPDFAAIGYERGVPMGGDLPNNADAKAPTFMVSAMRAAEGANLDRVQIIKGWVNANGTTDEHVYDVAWSDERKQGANGKLPSVGNTVDVKKGSYSNDIGSEQLRVVWTDPEFDPAQSAFYYARVIEIPTPRWVVYDALKFGVDIPPDAQTITQERAYTSPIWYTPDD